MAGEVAPTADQQCSASDIINKLTGQTLAKRLQMRLCRCKWQLVTLTKYVSSYEQGRGLVLQKTVTVRFRALPGQSGNNNYASNTPPRPRLRGDTLRRALCGMVGYSLKCPFLTEAQVILS